MKPRVLFSAPHDFLALDAFGSHLAIDKNEIWHRSEVGPIEIDAWIPNPGQHFVIDEEVLDLFPTLRLVATPSTGTNHIDASACERRGVAVRSLLDDRAAMDEISASAEYTFLHLLNALRRFDRALEEARQGRWRSREGFLRGRELQGRRVGLIGYGRIGTKLAGYLSAFGAEVQIFDPYVDPTSLEAPVCRDLEALFSSSEVVVVCCRLTPETTGLVTGDLVSLMPHGGIVVNTSRGEVLDEPSVCEALERREDLTLSVDVLAGEVSDRHADSCLWNLLDRGSVVITPHVAGVTVDSQEKAAQASLRLVVAFFDQQDS